MSDERLWLKKLILLTLNELGEKQLRAVVRAVDKKGLINTDWSDIESEGGVLDNEVMAESVAEKLRPFMAAVQELEDSVIELGIALDMPFQNNPKDDLACGIVIHRVLAALKQLQEARKGGEGDNHEAHQTQ